jgi:hypothetical protein
MLGEEGPGVDAPGELRILAELAERLRHGGQAGRVRPEVSQPRQEPGLELGVGQILGDGRHGVVGELDLAPGIAAGREQELRAAEGAVQLGLVVLEHEPGEVGERRARIDARGFELLEELPG